MDLFKSNQLVSMKIIKVQLHCVKLQNIHPQNLSILSITLSEKRYKTQKLLWSTAQLNTWLQMLWQRRWERLSFKFSRAWWKYHILFEHLLVIDFIDCWCFIYLLHSSARCNCKTILDKKKLITWAFIKDCWLHEFSYWFMNYIIFQ